MSYNVNKVCDASRVLPSIRHLAITGFVASDSFFYWKNGILNIVS